MYVKWAWSLKRLKWVWPTRLTQVQELEALHQHQPVQPRNQQHSKDHREQDTNEGADQPHKHVVEEKDVCHPIKDSSGGGRGKEGRVLHWYNYRSRIATDG